MRASEGNRLRVTELAGSRFSTALELMREGRMLEFEDTSFALDKDRKIIEISVVTQWQTSNLSETRALGEIERAVGVFEYLIKNSDPFKLTIEGFEPRYSLIDDYGMGCIELCHLDKGKLIWNSKC